MSPGREPACAFHQMLMGLIRSDTRAAIKNVISSVARTERAAVAAMLLPQRLHQKPFSGTSTTTRQFQRVWSPAAAPRCGCFFPAEVGKSRKFRLSPSIKYADPSALTRAFRSKSTTGVRSQSTTRTLRKSPLSSKAGFVELL